MDNKENVTAVKTKNITVGLVLGWIVGVIFITASIGVFTSSVLGGLAVLIAGLILVPPVNALLTEKLNVSLSGGIRTIIAIVLFIFGASTMPTDTQNETLTTDTDTPVVAETASEDVQAVPEQETAVIEDTVQDTPTSPAPAVTQATPTPVPVQVETTETEEVVTTPTPTNPRTAALTVLKANASSEWGDDYQMVQFEYSNQVEAYDWVMSRTAHPDIMAKAKREWNDDYQMVKFEYENQVEAYNWVTAQTQYPDIMGRAKREWGDDYQMVKFEYENQVEAFSGL
jgi:hypothetical protein